jgi:hypothetical protein
VIRFVLGPNLCRRCGGPLSDGYVRTGMTRHHMCYVRAREDAVEELRQNPPLRRVGGGALSFWIPRRAA